MRYAVALFVLAAVTATFTLPSDGAQDRPWIVFFHAEGCPDCAEIEGLLDGLTSELPETAVARYDIADQKSLRLLMELAAAYDVETSSVPVVFIGDEVVVGAGRAEEFELRNAIGACTIHGCPSPLERAASVFFPEGLLRLGLFAVLFGLLWWWQTSWSGRP